MSPRKQVNPFDFFSELFRANSDQVIHMVLYFDGELDSRKMQCAVVNAILTEPACIVYCDFNVPGYYDHQLYLPPTCGC